MQRMTEVASTGSRPKERQDTDDRHKWNLADIYSDWAEWEANLGPQISLAILEIEQE